MNISERGTRLKEHTGEYFRESKIRTGIFFVGTALAVSGGLAIGECLQNGDFGLATTGVEIVATQGIVTVIAGEIAGRIELYKHAQVKLEENSPFFLGNDSYQSTNQT